MRLAIATSLISLVAAAQPAFAEASTWTIDPAHSTAEFSVRHMMVSNVKGNFQNVSGTVEYDPSNLKLTKVESTIDASTIDTREPNRDAHLKSKDFFNVEQFPTITFKSSKIEPTEKGKFKMTGDLTMHGVTKQVVLLGEGPTETVTDKKKTQHVGASATTKINRKEFGIEYNSALETGGVMIGEEIPITIEIELVKKPTPVSLAK